MGRGHLSAEVCYRHPGHLAVEHCETCRRPVCGFCLWYAEAGQRLCPDHAAEALKAGHEVIPPERYADGIHASQVSVARLPGSAAPYQGNSTDVTALLAGMAGAAGLLYCAGLAWAVPFFAFALGLVAWLQSRDSVNPSRTRLLAGAGLAGGGIYMLFVMGIVLMFSMCMMVTLAASWTSSGGGP